MATFSSMLALNACGDSLLRRRQYSLTRKAKLPYARGDTPSSSPSALAQAALIQTAMLHMVRLHTTLLHNVILLTATLHTAMLLMVWLHMAMLLLQCSTR
ncbi:hypothetical protein AMTR_s00031p00224570 [Amborella trichopoda]|uniref:Uncharacterized protein n=1 Tax=Amborella trichopoda TaxID=13333 RepID=U5CTK7_AMBTC|nr:hypothetical protein AMTR_s00031p00224570 [Amborella trichopoda]